MLRCREPVPIFVHAPQRGVVRIGTLKARRALRTANDPALDADDVGLDLGTATLRPFVRAADVTRCART